MKITDSPTTWKDLRKAIESMSESEQGEIALVWVYDVFAKDDESEMRNVSVNRDEVTGKPFLEVEA